MNFQIPLLLWSLFGALCWVFFEHLKRKNDKKTKPTRKTLILSSLIGIVSGIFVALLYDNPQDSRPELFAGMLAYVATDLLNSLFVVTMRKRM